jgi:hypothetical protein
LPQLLDLRDGHEMICPDGAEAGLFKTAVRQQMRA